MKFVSFLLVSLMFIFSANLSFAAIKVGIYDIDKVLLTVDEGNAAQKKLEVEAKKLEEKFMKLRKEYEDMREKFEKQSAVLSDAGKKKQIEAITQKEGLLMAEQRESQMKMNKMKQELQDPLVEKIKVVVKDVVKNKGIDAAFITVFAPITAMSEEEITDDVISAYNKKHPVK